MNALNAIRAFLQGDGSVILPELELLLFALGILAIDAWVAQKEKYWNAGLALAGTLFSAVTLWMLRGQLQSKGDLLGFHETAIVDSYFLFFASLFLLLTALTVLLSIRYLEQPSKQPGSYYALLLFACAAAMLIVSAIDLLAVFLGIEILAISFFALLAFHRSEQPLAAAIKFALTSVFSSALLAFGFSILYGLSASTNIGRIAAALSQHTDLVHALQLSREHGAPAEHIRQLIQERVPIALQFDPHVLQFLPLVALALVLIGLFIKLGAAPFHRWLAPVFEKSPPPIAALICTTSAAAITALLLRLLMTVFATAQPQWFYVLAAVSLLSILIGSLSSFGEKNLLRFIAYAAVAQIGWLLLGMVAGNENGLTAIAFYVLTNSLAFAGIFAIASALRQPTNTSATVSELAGLYHRHPALALLFLAFIFSLVGVPGTAGFVGKHQIFLALLEMKHKYTAFAALACFLPAVFIFGKILLQVFRKPQVASAPLERPTMSSPEAIVLGICVFVTIAAGLYAEPFLRLAHYAFGQ